MMRPTMVQNDSKVTRFSWVVFRRFGLYQGLLVAGGRVLYLYLFASIRSYSDFVVTSVGIITIYLIIGLILASYRPGEDSKKSDVQK